MPTKRAKQTVPAPSAHEIEEARARAEHRAGWAFIWVLVGFKVATVVLIALVARSEEAAVLLVATTWYWLAVPVVAFGGALVFRYRLIRVRRRRAQLHRAEWLLEHAER